MSLRLLKNRLSDPLVSELKKSNSTFFLIDAKIKSIKWACFHPFLQQFGNYLGSGRKPCEKLRKASSPQKHILNSQFR